MNHNEQYYLLGTRNFHYFQVKGCYTLSAINNLTSLTSRYAMLKWDRNNRNGYIPARILMRDCVGDLIKIK